MPPEYIAILVVIVGIFRLIFPHLKNLKISQHWRKEISDTAEAIVFAGVAALFLIHFVARIFYIPSSSMLPTLQIRDVLLVSKLAYRLNSPRRGDIIIFRPPPSANIHGKEFIKRLIGLPGDIIEVKNQKVYINGIPIKEEYIKEPIYYRMPPTRVPENCYFVMGDNRNNSDDSHIWGFLPRKNVDGKALFIFLPPWRAKIFRTPSYPELETGSTQVKGFNPLDQRFSDIIIKR